MANSPNSTILTQSARVFLQAQPTASELATSILSVDQGVLSLPQAILQMASSAERTLGNTDELARLFFILFNRPPDMATFTLAMTMMESQGYTITDLAQLGLNFSTSLLSNSLNLSNKDFVTKLANLVFVDPNSILGLSTVLNQLVTQLDNSLTTRASVLQLACTVDNVNVKYHNAIEPSLDYLAATGVAPSLAELSAAQSVPELVLLKQILSSSGVSPYGANPYFSINGSKLTVSGNFASSFNLDLSTATSTLGTSATYRVFYSTDGGLSDSSKVMSSSLLNGITQVDATGLGPLVKSFNFQAANSGSSVIAPNVSSTLIGGAGNDSLVGGNAPTTFIAGSGNCVMKGGTGADTFYLGAGNDTVTGGAGADTFIYPSNVFVQQNHASSNILDFGNGADILNLALLAGNSGTAKAATVIVGSSARGPGFINTAAAVNNSVLLVYNTGQWVDTPSGGFTTRTSAQIASLFTQAGTPLPDGTPTAPVPVVFAKPSTVGSTYFVISFDPFSGADLFLVNNLAPLTSVDSSEVSLVGHLNLTGNLWQALNTTGSIVL
jgi:RTX calcium-binding nonapeptide repeat (4 copies)